VFFVEAIPSAHGTQNDVVVEGFKLKGSTRINLQGVTHWLWEQYPAGFLDNDGVLHMDTVRHSCCQADRSQKALTTEDTEYTEDYLSS
jgi:hypothetical protein